MDWCDLSLAQRQYVQQINDRLMVIERHAKREALTLIPQLEARVQDPQDGLYDYEIDLEVSFYLRADDPAYQDDEENMLVTLNNLLTYLKRYLDHPDEAGGVGGGTNYNELQSMDGDPQQYEHHCWLYHNLYDHSGLRWEDLLRIGHIGVELQVTYQYTCEVQG